MTVLLVLVTFVIFLSIEYVLGLEKAKRPAKAPALEVAPRMLPAIVAGFSIPDNLRYHPGHTWAVTESAGLVRMGLDDFAARLAGKIEKVSMPQRGQWVRQGQKVWTIARNGGVAEMVSPVEGVVTDVNEAVLRDPDLARRDPYGEGWLIAVNAPDVKTSFRNLLGGAVARKWMEEAATRLRMRMELPAMAHAQDGGIAVDDLTRGLPEAKWKELTQEFFLS